MIPAGCDGGAANELYVWPLDTRESLDGVVCRRRRKNVVMRFEAAEIKTRDKARVKSGECEERERVRT